jgi:TonB dependent receptor.
VDDARFDVLDRAPSEGTFRHYPPFAYFNLHANISKDIGKAVRLSFFANNVLNLRPRVWKNGRPKERLNQPPYVGMELRLTL